jgi:antitoxin component YwqK of YwqJK toxin-antitoxin module
MIRKALLILFVQLFYFSVFTACSLFSQDSTKLNGYQKFFYPKGTLSSEGLMINGNPDGYWKSYFENGKLKSEGNRKHFELDSTWKFFNEDGKLILEVEYKNGRKNGIKTTNLDREITKENYRNDIKDGMTRIYSQDQKLKMEIPFVNGLEQGFAKEYSADGNIISLIEYKRGFVIDRLNINRKDKHNLKQGRWYTFYESGIIRQEGMYKDDKKNGYFKEYTESGDLISVSKYINDIRQEEAEEVTKLDVQNEYYPDGKIKVSATYRNGIPEGIKREYNHDGQIQNSFLYRNGIITGEGIVREDGSRDGHWKEFYEDKTLKSEGDYKNGKPVGEWKYFYPNGKLEQAGKYSSTGKLQGTWKWFYDTGQLLQEEEYSNGVKDGIHTEYDENQKVIEEGEYVNGLEEGPWFVISGDYLERGTYRDGLKNGMWKTYFLFPKGNQTDSILSFSGNFIEDNPDGKHVYYWDNGKIKDEGLYIMSKKEGNWIIYNYDGTPFLVITYRNGVETKYDGVKIKPPFESGD